MAQTKNIFTHPTLWASLALFPAAALAQQNTSNNVVCFEVSSTNEAKLNVNALLSKGEATQALPAGISGAQLFVGKAFPSDPKLCYGPFPAVNDAALFAVSWVDGQPLAPLNVRITGFSMHSMTVTVDKKGEAKLNNATSFNPATAAFAQELKESLAKNGVSVGIVAPAKAYAFPQPDAFMPELDDDTLELTREQNVLSLGQERWCEESTGCLFWEKILVGETPRLAYIPAGHLIFLESALPSPDGSWKLFARARGTIPFVPLHTSSKENPKPAQDASQSVVVALWARGNGKETFDSLGTIEVPGASPEELTINFTSEGIALQSTQKAKPIAVNIDPQRYNTNAPSVAGVTPTNGQAPTANAPKPAAKPTVKYYTVRNGDSFWSISNKFGVSISALQKANKLSSKSMLHPGQKLVIPPKSAPPKKKK